MTTPSGTGARRPLIQDAAHWAWGWLAFRAVMAMPLDWKVTFALLPHAGLYAYTPDFDTFRDFMALPLPAQDRSIR